MWKIEKSSFSNLIVPYGGAFFINSNFDLEVKNIIILNVSTSDNNDGIGAPGFLFLGRKFYGCGVCCRLLSTSYRSLLYMSSSESTIVLNETSADASNCKDYSIVLRVGTCSSKSINCTRLAVNSDIATLHFGANPPSYYLNEMYAINNTGQAIFGHTCSTDAEMKSENIVLVDNHATSGVFGFWKYQHRIVNAYIIRNNVNKIYRYVTCTIIFDKCYHDGICKDDTCTINNEVNTKTLYEINTKLKMSCFSKQFCKMITIHASCKSKSLFCFFVIFIETSG